MDHSCSPPIRYLAFLRHSRSVDTLIGFLGFAAEPVSVPHVCLERYTQKKKNTLGLIDHLQKSITCKGISGRGIKIGRRNAKGQK